MRLSCHVLASTSIRGENAVYKWILLFLPQTSMLKEKRMSSNICVAALERPASVLFRSVRHWRYVELRSKVYYEGRIGTTFRYNLVHITFKPCCPGTKWINQALQRHPLKARPRSSRPMWFLPRGFLRLTKRSAVRLFLPRILLCLDFLPRFFPMPDASDLIAEQQPWRQSG